MKQRIALLVLPLIASGLSACGSDTPDEVVYAGPGSKWTAAIRADGTFNLTETTAEPDLVIDGTYTTLDTGFLKMTVTSATGPTEGTPTAGSQAYAMNIPGVVLIVKPIGDGDQIIPMVVGGECPSADTTLNWVQMGASDELFDVTGRDMAGSFSLTAASSTAALPTKWALDGSSAGTDQDMGTFSCSAGTATMSLADDATMYLTASTGAIVHTGSSSGIIFATEKKTLTGFSSLAGDYYGLVFASSDLYAIKMTMAANGAMTVESINVETGASDGNIPATVLNAATAVNSPGDGLIRYEFATATTEKVICVASDDLFSSGKSVLYCAGDDPGTSGENGAEGKMFSAIFFKK